MTYVRTRYRWIDLIRTRTYRRMIQLLALSRAWL
jgi:hypothetical protein